MILNLTVSFAEISKTKVKTMNSLTVGGSEIIQRFVLPLEKRCQHPAVVKLCTVKPFGFCQMVPILQKDF